MSLPLRIDKMAQERLAELVKGSDGVWGKLAEPESRQPLQRDGEITIHDLVWKGMKDHKCLICFHVANRISGAIKGINRWHFELRG